MRSDPKDHTNPHLSKTSNDGTGLDWHNSRRGSFGPLEQRGSAATSSDIPLVHVGSKAKISSEVVPAGGHGNATIPWPTENGNGRVIRGFDAV